MVVRRRQSHTGMERIGVSGRVDAVAARHDELKARVTAFATADGEAEALAGMHVAVMQYGAGDEAIGSDSLDRALAQLIDLATHIVHVFSSVAIGASGARLCPGRGVSELLDLLPTIAKTTSALGGPAYDGAITTEVLRLASAGVWMPPTVLPVLNLFAELPGVMTDEQATELCTDLLRVADSAPEEDIPGICRALVNLVTKHPTSTVWPSTLRAVLQRVPSTSLSTALCMIDLVLQHAPATGGTLIANFQAEAMSKTDLPEFVLLLILSQTHAYKEQALSLLTAAFAADTEVDRDHAQRHGDNVVGDGVRHAGASAITGATSLSTDHGSDQDGSISAIVQAVTSADARLARTLTELGLHWCDTAGASNRAGRLRHTGCVLLSEVFKQHDAARREVLSVAFSAVVEEPSLQVKNSYCSLIEELLTEHREMMADQTEVLQAWLSSIQTLPFALQKRIVNAVLDVAAVNGPLTSHVSMTMRKLMMEKATDSRLVALHGLCAVVRMGMLQGAATYMADAVASLKSAFEMGYSVRKQLYLELASLFRSCKAHNDSGVDVHWNFLQQRVRSQLLRYVEHADAPRPELVAQGEGDVLIRWSDCFDCVGQHAYAKEPLAELVVCVLELLSSSAAVAASNTGIEMKLLMSSVLSMVRQCCSVEMVCNWGPDAIITTQQKLDIILPLQQVLLQWLPAINAVAKTTGPRVDPAQISSDIAGDSEATQDRTKTQQFWLTESYAMLFATCDILGNDLTTCSPMQSITISRMCDLLGPYMAYITGTKNFRQAFELPTVPAIPSATPTPAELPNPDTVDAIRSGGGRVLRQRRSGKAVPWWVGNASPASGKQRGADYHDVRSSSVEEETENTSQSQGLTDIKAEKAFPPGIYVCTDMIRRYLKHSAVLVERTSANEHGDNVFCNVSKAFSQLVCLYTVTNSMRWDTAKTAGRGRASSDSDDAMSSEDTFSTFQAGLGNTAHGERRAFADEIIYPKLLQPIEAVVSKSKRPKLQLHSQQEMCYYKCRAACLDALVAAVTCAQHCVDIDLFRCPALVEAYRVQPGLETTTAGMAPIDTCAVYFSRQLRDDVAAGITPPLLTAYVRWIQFLLQRTGAEAPAAECRGQVAESFHSILSKFEIDAPGIVKILLQALLDLSVPCDASNTALCVVRTLLPKKLNKSRPATAGNDDELLVCASLQCKHAAIRAAIRFLLSELKATRVQTGETTTLATIIELLCDVVAEKCAAGHAPLRPILAGLVQVTIGRAADVARVLHDTWPSKNRSRGNRGGRWRVDTIDTWPALYCVVEDCMLKLLPAVRKCSWLRAEGALNMSASARKRSSGGRQQSHVPRVLQAVEDFDAEVTQLCQLATIDGASAFDAIAGGVARPILKSIKAIQSAIATSARENTAAAAQEAQQVLQGSSRHQRKQPLQAKRARKRKRHSVRSRNSYVDAVLNDEEDGGDNYADLEDWIVFKRGRTYK